MSDTNISLFLAVTKMAAELNSLYKDGYLGRRDLFEFMDANEWFGITPTMKNKEPLISVNEFERLRSTLTLWLSAYKKSGRDKINLILDHYCEKYPITCRLYRDFITRGHLEDNASAWKLLDYLLSEIDREIIDYEAMVLDEMAKKMTAEATIQCSRMFSEFLHTAKYNGKPLVNWMYDFGSRGSPELINDAYSFDDFSVMAYCVFNEEMWVKQNLIKKAVQSRRYADLWLMTALHFISALRMSDMRRLPAPALPCDGESMLKNVLNGTFTEHDAAALVDELCIRLELKPIKPSKTSKKSGVPDIKLFVPGSFKVPLGIIIAIALAHHPEITPGGSFVMPLDRHCNVRDFFGDDFVKALGNRNFSTRRSNKSYLQGIEDVASSDSAPGKPKGYMLASLARSHKGGIGSMAKTTDIYLRDAKFTGYTPEFIIQEMFERGVFSFIPVVLLELYAGSKYKALPIREQTKLINEIGIAAHRIEWTADMVERTLEKSRNAVTAILRDPTNIRENVGDMLQNIASGNAPSRQKECLCLMTAAGLPCVCPDRDVCIGCGYEIYTRTAIHTLMNEYKHLVALKQAAKVSDSWRYEKMLDRAILPAMSEILNTMEILYKGEGVDEIFSIVKEGIKSADSVL